MAADSVSARLRTSMNKQGINCVQLATAANVKTSFLYDILNGKSANPSAVQLAKVASALNVSMSYLVSTDHPYAEYPPTHQHNNTYVTVGYIALDEQSGKIISQFHNTPTMQLRKDWLEYSLGVSANNAKFFFVSDDTMSPTLVRGDAVLIDTSDIKPASSGIFLIFDGNSLTLRNVEATERALSTHVHARGKDPHHYKNDTDLKYTLVVGRAVWLSRRI